MTQSPQTVTPVSPGSESRPRRPGRVRAALRRIATPSLLIGVGLVVLTSLFGIIGPFFVADPLAISSGGRQPPSAEHWLGSTQPGQDGVARLAWVRRGALSVGLVVATVALVLAACCGVLGG